MESNRTGADQGVSGTGSWQSTDAPQGTTGQYQLGGTNGATWQITGYKYTTEVTEFEHKSHGSELSLCQRYYFRLTSNDAGQRYGSGMGTSSASDILIHHPVPMRSKPTALETSGTAMIMQWRTSTWEVCNVVPVLQVAHTHSTMVRTNQTKSLVSVQELALY